MINHRPDATLYFILVSIPTSYFFAKFVYWNMMRNSKEVFNEGKTEGAKSELNYQNKKTLKILEFDFNTKDSSDYKEAVKLEKKMFLEYKLIFYLNISSIVLGLITLIVSSLKYMPLFLLIYLCFLVGVMLIISFSYFKNRKTNYSLVVLRVFGLKKNTQFLFEKIVYIWNFIGTSFTIADPIYAKSEFGLLGNTRKMLLTIVRYLIVTFTGYFFAYIYNKYVLSLTPDFSIDDSRFLTIGSLYLFADYILTVIIMIIIVYFMTRKMFLKDPKNLYEAIHNNSNFKKRWNGMGKQVSLYCHDNIWKLSLSEILKKAEIVIMDLRGFSEEKRGCSYEINYLMNHFDMRKILYIVNDSTNINFVKNTMQEEFSKISSDSPNCSLENPEITIYHCKKQNSGDVRQILKVLINKLFIQIGGEFVKSEKGLFDYVPLWMSSVYIAPVFMIILGSILLLME